MRRKNIKTKRTFQPEAYVPPLPAKESIPDYNGFKPGDKIFFNASLVGEKFSHGTLKEILIQSNGVIVYFIWDEEKGMWRHLTPDRVFHTMPPKSKKGDK